MNLRLDGWKGIAGYLGKSDRWCRKQAARTDNPLPARREGGWVFAWAADLDAWRNKGDPYAPRKRGSERTEAVVYVPKRNRKRV